MLAGDIYQIEYITFGNCFTLLKKIVKPTSVYELNFTWRSTKQGLLDLWELVRNGDDRVDEMLVKKEFSEEISEEIFKKQDEDEIKYRNADEDDDSDLTTIVPFSVAYAVSIHKSQGLEYNFVKLIITNEIDELITHSIFYTAITRAKEKLKIYWSAECQNKIISTIKHKEDNKDGLSYKK